MTLEKRVGKIITIVGGDRSGKQTQATLLYERLKREGYDSCLLDFPQYHTLSGEMVKEYLAGAYGSKEQLGARLPSLLYAVNRFQEKEKLFGWLRQGSIVVLDRYIESNMVYQSAKLPVDERRLFLEWLEKLEHDIFGLPKSDIVVYLHVPSHIAEQLAQKEENETGKKKDIHEQDQLFQKKVVMTYLSLAQDKQWEVIECIDGQAILPREKIAEMIWSKVQARLNS